MQKKFSIFRFLLVKKEISKDTFIFVSSLFIILIYNFITINNFNNISFINKFTSALLAIMVLQIFLYIFSFSTIVLKLWVLSFIFISGIVSYFIFSFSIFVSPTLLGAIFETSNSEVFALLGIETIIWGLIFGALPAFYFGYTLKIKNQIFLKYYLNKKKPYLIFYYLFLVRKKIIVFIGISIVTLAILEPVIFKKSQLKIALSSYMPMNYIASSYMYFKYLRETKDLVDITKKYNFIIDNQYTEQDQGLNIILVIGESNRAMNQSYNGYERNTNPYTSQLDNFINFSNVSSCGTLSRESIACLLSYKSQSEFSFPIEESNIISVFKSLGFYTAFLSTQPINDGKTNTFYLSSKDADYNIFNNVIKQTVSTTDSIKDEHLLPFLKNIKEDQKNKNKFIVVYNLGSHFNYQDRYPDEFAIFTPTCTKGVKRCSNLEYNLNGYDNSIIYGDYILKQIIDMYSDENTFVYYVSDHGQYLGEEGRFFHGGSYEEAGKELTNVAQFIWVSNSLKSNFTNMYAKIEEKKDTKISQDYVFHTLTDCFGIKSEVIKKNLSLCK